MNTRTITLIHTLLLSCTTVIICHISAFDTWAEPFQSSKYRQKSPLTSPQCNEFTFDANQSRIPHDQNASYFWDFGDGHTSTEPVVTHRYQHSGNYTVTLSIDDNSGFESSVAKTTQQVRVNIPPKVSLISDDQACINKPLALSAIVTDSNRKKDLHYSWNFGDGTVSNQKTQVIKSYKRGGNYKVLLTVKNQSITSCTSQTAEKVIHINEPPHAQANHKEILRCVADPSDMIVDFDASATTDVNGDPLSYAWDFGDGYQENGREVSHRYQKIGIYDAKLIVSDNTNLQCATDIDFVTVKFNKAPIARAGKNITVCAGDRVAFDGSKSFIYKKGTEIAQWFFGDGTKKYGLKATHRYKQPGIYQATLSLENKLNKTCPVSRDARTITVNSPPIANVENIPSQCAGKTVFFDASSTIDSDGDPLKYYWNFGDGSTSQIGAKVSHRYNQGGRYRVSLIVDDQKETSCSTATAQTHIDINTPPIADAGPNHACCIDKRTSFSASGSSDPDGNQLTYTWDFGDGSQSQGENVTHAYVHEGSYNVTLTVDDQSESLCGQSTDHFVAVIRESPLPIISVR